MIAGNDQRTVEIESGLIVHFQMPAIQPETNSSRNFKQPVKQVVKNFGEYKKINLLLSGNCPLYCCSFYLINETAFPLPGASCNKNDHETTAAYFIRVGSRKVSGSKDTLQ